MCVCFYMCVTVDIGEVLRYLKPLKLIHLVCLLHLLFTNNGIRAKTQTKKAKNINHLCNLAKYLKNKILDLRLSLNSGVFTLCLFKYFVCMSLRCTCVFVCVCCSCLFVFNMCINLYVFCE